METLSFLRHFVLIYVAELNVFVLNNYIKSLTIYLFVIFQTPYTVSFYYYYYINCPILSMYIICYIVYPKTICILLLCLNCLKHYSWSLSKQNMNLSLCSHWASHFTCMKGGTPFGLKKTFFAKNIEITTCLPNLVIFRFYTRNLAYQINMST